MILAITNRQLVEPEAFCAQIEKLAAAGPDGIILREKDLNEVDYGIYAKKCKRVCDSYGTKLIVNHYWQLARMLEIPYIHVSMAQFRELIYLEEEKGWERIGVSVHSAEEAAFAQAHGADYLIAGHIFDTDCKKGLPGRGIEYLKAVCEAVTIPVYAIGGINESNAADVLRAGADGICMMSGLMCSENPEMIIRKFTGRCNEKVIELDTQ